MRKRDKTAFAVTRAKMSKLTRGNWWSPGVPVNRFLPADGYRTKMVNIYIYIDGDVGRGLLRILTSTGLRVSTRTDLFS